jgi:hypothetical protein
MVARKKLSLLALAFAGAALLLPGCDSKKDEVDLEKQQAIYLLLTTPGPDQYRAACAGAVAAGGACSVAASGSNATYLAAVAASFGISVSGSNEAVCLAYSEAPAFARFSPGARVCFFNCEANYWNTNQTAGGCSAANYAATLSAASTAISSCNARCLDQRTLFP